MKTKLILTLLTIYLIELCNVILLHLVGTFTFKFSTYNGLRYHPIEQNQHQQTYHHHHRIISLAYAEQILSPSAVVMSDSVFSVKCPPDRLLYPCRCHHNEHIICTESMTYSLSHVFRAIRKSMLSSIHYNLSPTSGQFPRPQFKELILSNKFIEELDDNLFNLVRFQRIILKDMKSLVRIKSNAFNGTNMDVQHFEIRGENKLGTKYTIQLFDALSSLIHAKEMYLELNHLEMIPSYAFRDMQINNIDDTNSNNWFNNNKRIRLERLHLISKSLTQISSYAFYELNSLRYIKIHSKIGLQRISAHAFDMLQPFSHPLMIDLHRNNLKLSSFENDTFQHVNRPVYLDLSHNNLTTISQYIFERFLNSDPQNVIKMRANPLECDCKIYWLLKDRVIYINQIQDALCEEFIDIWTLDETAFRKCDQHMNYMPRLIFRNSAIYSMINDSGHNHQYLILFLFLSLMLFFL